MIIKLNKFKLKLSLILSLLSLYSFNSFGLVDYSDPESSPTNQTQTTFKKQDTKSNLVWHSDLSLDMNYELMDSGLQKIGKSNIGLHFQTPVNVFFDAKYWYGSSNGTSQNGNPKFLIGFNWLRIGGSADEAQFNLLTGVRLKSNSTLASSRTDKIFGLETIKKFGSFGLGLAYDASVTDEPSILTDLSIGNIHRFEISAAWMATSDIQFEFTIENFKVSNNASSTRENRLLNDLSFSTISPKMNLQIFRSVSFELGARYALKKAKSSQDLKRAKLVDLNGAYSNSVFSGLNISI